MTKQVGGGFNEPLHAHGLIWAVRTYVPVVVLLAAILVTMLAMLGGLTFLTGRFLGPWPASRPLFMYRHASVDSAVPADSQSVPASAPAPALDFRHDASLDFRHDASLDFRHDDQTGGHLMSASSLSVPSPRKVSSGARRGEEPVYGESRIGDEAFTPDGLLSPRVVADEIERRRGALTAAYVRALRDDSALAGEVELRFTIDESGDVRGVSVTRDTLRAPAFIDRIEQIVETWRFPAPPAGAPIEVIYPFTFKPLSE